jgi:putative cofactor-binding repeat protein
VSIEKTRKAYVFLGNGDAEGGIILRFATDPGYNSASIQGLSHEFCNRL